MENAFLATIQVSGIMRIQNVKVAQRHMFTTKIAENAYVQTIYRLIRGLNVCNVSSQATGMQTKEDAFNVQTNKSLTD
jgi:hypothetical protein